MKNMKQIQEQLDEVIERTINGDLDVSIINGVGRAAREKARYFALQHRSAELQGKLGQLDDFYGLK